MRQYAEDRTWVMRALLAILMVHCSLLISWSQTLTGRAPAQVAVGEQFRLTYTVNTQDVREFRAGKIPDGFEVLMGPNSSYQSSIQMINGRTTSSASITYTYILMARKNGNFTIPSAHVVVNGNTIFSNELRVKVSGEAQNDQSGSQGGRQSRGYDNSRSSGTSISGNELFIKVSANKSRVYEQEPILLTYKVYYLVDLEQLSVKMPDLKNFYTREVPLPQQKTPTIETLNGRPYRVVKWSQYVMFPQTSGKLEIPSIMCEGIVRQRNMNIDPFEAFFNGGSGYTQVKKTIKAPGLTIDVMPLPKRPANFSGGVGSFTVTSQLDKTEVKANDPIKLRVVVKGAGNMKLLKQPVVKFPKDFDTYDVKISDKTSLTGSGLEGSITYDFLAVPRHQGTFDIPPVEYTYYDLKANDYKTITTEGYTLKVAKGAGGGSSVSSYSSQEDVRMLNSDIHHIKTGDSSQHAVNDFFFGSTGYWSTVGILLLGFVSLFVIFRRRAIENANIVKQRAGRANKVAVKRLKKAHSLMQGGRQNEFYDEVLRTLWGYVGDKLNMPVEQLSRENISQQLGSRQVDDATVSQFIGAIDDCEFARYAPGDAKGNMNKVYESAMTAITQIAMKLKVIILLLTLVPLTAMAVTKAEADKTYTQERYQEAAGMYEQLLKNGVSADIYYNLGNAYYRMDNMTKAVLNYERALLLDPGDKDIRFNLQMARSKTIDKITPESEMFFVTWYKSCVNLMGVDAWGWMALIALAFVIVLSLIYLFSNPVWLRKVGFFGGIFMLLLFLASILFAWEQKRTLWNRNGAIVIKSAVSVKSTPSDHGTDLFILHEGTKVTITDGTMRDWYEIRVDDGKTGWLEANQVEKI